MGDRGGEEEGDGVGRTVVQNALVGGTVRRGTDGLKRELEQQLRSVGLCCKAIERFCISKAQRRHAGSSCSGVQSPRKGLWGGGGEGRPRVQAACAHSRKCCICSRICALRANPRERCQPRLVELLLLTDCFMPHRPLCLPSWNGMNSIKVERGQVEFK